MKNKLKDASPVEADKMILAVIDIFQLIMSRDMFLQQYEK